jgi:general secretion pathway protein I
MNRAFRSPAGRTEPRTASRWRRMPPACLPGTGCPVFSAQNRRSELRAGLTLLEIILALALFFGALAALSQMTWNASRAAVQARLKTQAILRCEAKLAEILAGVEPLQMKSQQPFPDNSQWVYSVLVAETAYPNLLQIEVRVSHMGQAKLANVDFSLRRWMRDPGQFMDAALLLKEEKQKQTLGTTPQ